MRSAQASGDAAGPRGRQARTAIFLSRHPPSVFTSVASTWNSVGGPFAPVGLGVTRLADAFVAHGPPAPFAQQHLGVGERALPAGQADEAEGVGGEVPVEAEDGIGRVASDSTREAGEVHAADGDRSEGGYERARGRALVPEAVPAVAPVPPFFTASSAVCRAIDWRTVTRNSLPRVRRSPPRRG